MLHDILTRHIELIYPREDAHALSAALCAAFALPPDAQAREEADPHQAPSWSQDDSFLITYGDSLMSNDKPPLQNMLDFLTDPFAKHGIGRAYFAVLPLHLR